MPLGPLRDWEHRKITAWSVAVIAVVALALMLAVVSLILAIRQTRSLARARVEELRLIARPIIEQAQTQAVLELEDFLGALATNVRRDRTANPARGVPDCTWLDRIFVFGASPTNLLIWQRDPSRRGWVRSTTGQGGNDRFSLTVLGMLFPSALAAQINPRTERVQFAYDVFDGHPLIVAHLVDAVGMEDSIVVGGQVNIDRFIRTFVDPLRPADRIAVVRVADNRAHRRDSRYVWSEQFDLVAPPVHLVPTDDFVHRQEGIVRRQTLFFIAGTILAMGALLAVMWSMWRVFNREITLSRMKQSFVADVSHELKTPLALIRLFGETLLAGRVPTEEKRREYYEIITRESSRLTHLINNILDFARIESGRKRYDMKPVDIAALARETYEAYRLQLDHAGFEHQLVIADNVPTIHADRDAIAQALINLINNAMKYTDGDDKFLGIDVCPETRRDQHGVLISVSDRGIGIRPEDRHLLFSDFYRSDDDRVRKKRGAGLGLALVKHIVDGHGGIADVESRLVKGSTFRIFLPRNNPPGANEDTDHVSNPAR